MSIELQLGIFLAACAMLGHAAGVRHRIRCQFESGSITPDARDRTLFLRIVGTFVFGPLNGLYLYQSNPGLHRGFGPAAMLLFGVAYLFSRSIDQNRRDAISVRPSGNTSADVEDRPELAYRKSPVRYTLDTRGLHTFQRAVNAYNRALSHVPERNTLTPSELIAVQNDPDLGEGERLLHDAIRVETANAGNVSSWEQITYLCNAIRAHLWLALLYIHRHEPERCATSADLAQTEYNRLPQEVRERDEGLGMKADILFRFVEADEMRGSSTPDDLLTRYTEILRLDERVGDRDQASEVRSRIAALIDAKRRLNA